MGAVPRSEPPRLHVFEAYARVGRWQLFPLIIDPLRTYSGAPTSENEEILGYSRQIHEATEGRGTWSLDRGFDRRELLVPMLRMSMTFIVRQRGARNIVPLGGEEMSVKQRVAEALRDEPPARWPADGWSYTEPVTLPESPEEELLLVACWRLPDSEPLLLLVSPRARRAGRTGKWFVKSYRRRWGAEDATRGIKQCFHLEGFLVRSWRSIRRLIWFVAIVFYWLNLWGNAGYKKLCDAFTNHPWRVSKEATYLFHRLASQIARFLHPKPKISAVGYFDAG